MAAETQNNRERQLFATLLASKPARARSPLAFALSIGVHIVLLGLLIFASEKIVHKISIGFITDVTQPEETPVALVPVVPQRAVKPDHKLATARPARRRNVVAAPEAPLTFTPGPIQPIPAPSAGPPTAEPPDNGVAPTGSLADQLRPSKIDPRLMPGTSYSLPPGATPADVVRSRIADALRIYNDSIADEDAAHKRALDWTIKTKDGKQWGIGADGKLHLGDIVIPIPLAFSPPPGRRDEINAHLNAWAEIEAQASREIGRQTFNDRVKAIRARKDKEREDKKKTEPAPVTSY